LHYDAYNGSKKRKRKRKRELGDEKGEIKVRRKMKDASKQKIEGVKQRRAVDIEKGMIAEPWREIY